jgi:hypothetical protein
VRIGLTSRETAGVLLTLFLALRLDSIGRCQQNLFVHHRLA